MPDFMPTTWNNGGPPGVSKEELDKLGSQYNMVKTELQRADGTGAIKPHGSNLDITINEAIPDPYADTGTGNQVLSWMAKALKSLTGAAHWYTGAIASITTIWAKFHASTGHKHTGDVGDAPPIPITSIAPIPLTYDALLFGDSSDGDVTVSSNTTLTRDMFYRNLTVNSGVTLKTGGWRVFVVGVLTNNGTIDNSGGNGQSVSDPEGVSGSNGAGGAAGYFGGGASGGGIANVGCCIGGAGGNGGNYASQGGYCAGGYVREAAVDWCPHLPATTALFAATRKLASESRSVEAVAGGASGGLGYAGGGGGLVIGGTGGGGGVVGIAANTIINNGSILARGGQGGSATATSGSNYGGGGGGGGGIWLIYRTLSPRGTISAAGGARGSSASGKPGQSGSAGKVIEVSV